MRGDSRVHNREKQESSEHMKRSGCASGTETTPPRDIKSHTVALEVPRFDESVVREKTGDMNSTIPRATCGGG